VPDADMSGRILPVAVILIVPGPSRLVEKSMMVNAPVDRETMFLSAVTSSLAKDPLNIVNDTFGSQPNANGIERASVSW
jgi:hypothetical protein